MTTRTRGAVFALSQDNQHAHAALDNAAADLTLLQSNLQKSKAVTDRTIVGLTSFDDRLARLERSVDGIHGSTVGLTRVNKNITAVLAAIDNLLANHNVVDEHEAIVGRGPRANDIAAYQTSLDKLVKALQDLQRTGTGSAVALGKAPEQDETAARITRAIESGARQLGQVFLGWVRDYSAGDARNDGIIPSNVLQRMTNLLGYIRQLPAAGANVEKELQRSYGEIRGSYMATVLESIGKEAVESSKAGAAAGGATLGDLLKRMFAMAKAEHALAGTVFPAFAANYIYRAIVPPSLNVMFTIGQSLNAIVKRSLSSTVGIAWRCFADLQAHSDVFDDWIRAKASRKDNELGELLHAFRGSCLRSLPEFIEDTKSWGVRPLTSSEQGQAAVGDMTVNVIAYMTQLTAYQDIAESFLQTLGDGNWLMGGVAPTARRSGNSLLERYLGDVLATLLNALDARSRSLRVRSSACAAIFVLNNLAYCRREILTGSASDVLGEQAEDDLNRRMRSSKAAYLEVFSPLVSCLMDAGESTSLAGALKSAATGGAAPSADRERRLARFADALSDIEGLHRTARLDPGEAELRERMHDEVERMVLPTYSKFVAGRAGQPPPSSGKTKALDVGVVQERLEALFR